MANVWIGVIFAIMRHPVIFVRSLFEARDERRTGRVKRQNREELAKHLGISAEDLAEIEQIWASEPGEAE